MAWLIEAYEPTGAILLAERYSLAYLEALIAQTSELRKPEEEKDIEQLEEWAEENRDRKVEFAQPDGKKIQFNIANFVAGDFEDFKDP